MAVFKAFVHTGIINDKKKGPTRGRWIYASDIPREHLDREWKGPHPHDIPGLAWAIDTERDGNVYQWRRLANAQSESASEQDVDADPESPRWFTV